MYFGLENAFSDEIFAILGQSVKQLDKILKIH